MSNVIFLDIDGVLCVNGKIYIQLLSNLEKIVNKTGASVVLSSNWRLYEYYRIYIIKLLKEYKINVIGYTESINDERPIEIFRWILKNRPNMCIVIDDRSLDKEYFGSRIKDYFIKTDERVGLTIDCVSKAIFILTNYTIRYGINTIRLLYKSNRNHPTTYQLLHNKRRSFEINRKAFLTYIIKKKCL